MRIIKKRCSVISRVTCYCYMAEELFKIISFLHYRVRSTTMFLLKITREYSFKIIIILLLAIVLRTYYERYDLIGILQYINDKI